MVVHLRLVTSIPPGVVYQKILLFNCGNSTGFSWNISKRIQTGAPMVMEVLSGGVFCEVLNPALKQPVTAETPSADLS
jgi:hypothetical protein